MAPRTKAEGNRPPDLSPEPPGPDDRTLAEREAAGEDFGPSLDRSAFSSKRTLARNVVVEGVAYGPGLPAVLTPEVEAQITNPAAWGE